MSWRIACLLCVWGLTSLGSVRAQYMEHLHTNSLPPSQEALDRLNLTMSWYTYLPVSRLCDGFAQIQPVDDQLFVQSNAGLLMAIDARTGRLQWQYQPIGRLYTGTFPVSVNAEYVFFVNGTRLYIHNRKTGIQILAYEMGTAPVTGPIIDGEDIFVSLGNNRLVNYEVPQALPILQSEGSRDRAGTDNPRTPEGRIFPPLQPGVDPFVQIGPGIDLEAQSITSVSGNNKTPSLTLLPKIRPPYRLPRGNITPSLNSLDTVLPPYQVPDGSRSPSIVALPPSVARAIQLNDLRPKGLEPKINWEYFSNVALPFRVVATADRLFVPTSRDRVLILKRSNRAVLREVPTDGDPTADPAIYGTTAYVATSANRLVALNLETGQEIWRFAGPGPSSYRPLVTPQSIFTGSRDLGLVSVNRRNGKQVWESRRVDLIHALNPKFIYASNGRGELLVLDRQRGLVLSEWDIRCYPVPVRNMTDDRLYLAANNGLLVALHDRAYTKPVAVAPPPPEDQAPGNTPTGIGQGR